MSAQDTAALATQAADLIAHTGIHQDPRAGHFIDKDGRLDLVASIFRASTGVAPADLRGYNADQLAAHIRHDEAVMDLLRWLSEHITHTYGAEAPGEPGEPDYIEHVTAWADGTLPYWHIAEADQLGPLTPTVDQVIALLQYIADTLPRTDIDIPA
ncbi:hypothetical protein ACFV3R_25620 [Streptomyces sp. NPDC059740]|uniref:hypothetical protein n=1 Tax=Streptomyces sp. NPDC059740 TaxID=3346926 RepID=UPI003646E0A5